jgi:hypothetical protein
MKGSLLLACLALQLPTAGHADNLVQNSDFATDLSQWTAFSDDGTAVWDGDIGSPAAGSAHLSAGYQGEETLTQCVAVPSTLASSIDFSANVYMFSDTINNNTGVGTGYILSLEFFSATDCSGSGLVSNPINLAVPTAFTRVSSNFVPLGAGYRSVLISLAVGGTSFNFTDFAFDHIFVDQVTDRIFGADFEDPNPYGS